ncbi:hypothetical protein M3Y99_00334000 [Aphelenchoides fujianensis]|nr:hypothetical protein M3Y99_00334000 [Aphelenchoides fujianensis]
MAAKAKAFARKYFTDEELIELRNRVQAARRAGADRWEIRRLVNEMVLKGERRAAIRAMDRNLREQFETV